MNASSGPCANLAKQGDLRKWEQMRDEAVKLAREASVWPQLAKVWAHFYDAADLLDRSIAALKEQDEPPRSL